LPEDTYKVITARSEYDLQDRVNRYMQMGWEPLGAMTMTASTELLIFTETEYGQAMTKKPK